MKNEVLLLNKITKIRAGNKVLDDFFLEILSGEIVNLIGLDGAGKKDIYSILFGEDTIDAGDIWFAGQPCGHGKNLPVERVNGIFFIGNNELIIPDLSVAENLYIIEKINYFQFSVSKRKMENQAQRLFDQFGVDINPKKKAKKLNRYECCVLRLMRAYVKRAKLIVIDDILDDRSFEKIDCVIEILERFKREGISILWMNSYPDAITEIADRVTVIRKGRNSASFYKNDYDRQKLMKILTGKENYDTVERKGEPTDELAFSAVGIHTDYFQNMSFQCYKGEILGIYDLQNIFSRELRDLLLGKTIYSGDLIVENKVVKANAEYKLARNKIGIIDGDSYQSLIFEEITMQENVEIAGYKKIAKWKCFLRGRAKRYLWKISSEICENNQIQKSMKDISRRDAMQIVYSRWKLANPRVLFCFQPFVRLDAISRKELEEILQKFSQKKTGIVLSSANLSELLPLCDRVLVIERNRIIREIRQEAT